jgi:hypothetical protein
MNLNYNFSMLERLEHEFRAKKHTHALKTILLLFVYSSFLSFIVSFQHIKSSKCTKLFSVISPIHLYYNHHIVEPLWHE